MGVSYRKQASVVLPIRDLFVSWHSLEKSIITGLQIIGHKLREYEYFLNITLVPLPLVPPHSIQSLQEFGILDYLYKKALSNATECLKPIKAKSGRALDVGDFYGVFSIYLGGETVSELKRKK